MPCRCDPNPSPNPKPNPNVVRQVLNAMQMWSRDQKALATGAGGKGGKGRSVRVTEEDLRTMAKVR